MPVAPPAETTERARSRRRRGVAGAVVVVAVLVSVVVATRVIGDLGPALDVPGGRAGSGPSDASVELPEAVQRPPTDVVADGPTDEDEPVTCLIEGCIAWTLAIPPENGVPTVVSTGDLLLVSQRGMPGIDDGAGSGSGSAGGTTPDPFAGRVVAVDALTGVIRWELTLDLVTDDPTPPEVAAAAGHLVVVDEPGTVTGYALDDLTMEWGIEVEGAVGVRQAVLMGSDLLVAVRVAADDGVGWRTRVVALDPATGAERWSSTAVEHVVFTSAGPVLFAAFGGIWGLDPEDGTERWREPLHTLPPQARALGDLLVVEQGEATVHDARDGSVVATLPGRGRDGVRFPPSEDAEGLLVLAEDGVGHVAADGSVWRMPVPGCCIGSSVDASSVTVLAMDGTLRRFARDDGSALDTTIAGGQQLTGEPSLLVDDNLFVVDATGASGRTFDVWIEEVWTGRRLARLGTTFPIGVTDQGGVLLHRSGEVTALRAPGALADMPDATP